MDITKLRTRPLKSSFLSCEKDTEEIIKRLFVSSQPYSDQLKRLLMITTKDCLDEFNNNYSEIVKNTSIKELIEGNYINLIPVVNRKEHEEEKAYIILSFDNFVSTTNPEFRDHLVSFDIICHHSSWMLDNYQQRAMKIAGIIDGLLNNTKLSGIGTLQFFSLNRLPIDHTVSGYTLSFRATNGSDDSIPGDE